MAASFKALMSFLMLANAALVAVGSECAKEIKGKCNLFGCFAWRGPTTCVGSFPFKVCQCDPGSCANADGTMCVKPHNEVHTGDDVEVRDSKNNVWMPGKVTAAKPLEVKPEGFTRSFAWAFLQKRAPMFMINEAVEARDDGQDWLTGKVTSIKPLEVKTDALGQSFTYAHVRPLDWKKKQADEVAGKKNAQEELAAAANTLADRAVSVKDASKTAASDAVKLGKIDVAAKQASDEAAEKSKAAMQDESTKRSGLSLSEARLHLSEAKKERSRRSQLKGERSGEGR